MASLGVDAARRFTAVGLVVLGLSTVCAQQISSADPADQEIAKLVSQMMPRIHISRAKLSDEISSKLLDRFLKDLDPQKMYFLQGDIAEFEKYRTRLDDELKQGNVGFAYRVFDVYLERFRRQMGVAHHWIDQEHDFTLDEFLETDSDKIAWARSLDEVDDRWRKSVKYDLLQFRLDSIEAEDSADPRFDVPNETAIRSVDDEEQNPRERLHKRYRNNLRYVEKYDTLDQLEIYLKAMTHSFDPHSEYMSPATWANFEISLKLSLDGIGAALRSDEGYTVVAEIIKGGAASEDGRLQVGDKIIGVGQEDGELVDIYDMRLNDVVQLIRGPRGTVVRLQVKPKEGSESKLYALTRQKIEFKESEVKGKVIETGERLGRSGRVGVISLPSFYRDFAGAESGREFKSAAVDIERILTQFAREKVDAVVVDLRHNGGGSLNEAIEVSGHFIDRGPVVQVKEPSGYVKSLDDEESGVMYDGPLVVLCNRLSASASEIFGGVIKDYRRGIVVGDTTTHGKGTVQNLVDVAPSSPFRLLQSSDRGKLKITISQFYRVNGDSTQNRGVRSDIVIPSPTDVPDIGESSLDNALPFDQIPRARYAPGRYINNEVIAALKHNSEVRVSKDEDFQKIRRSIERYLERMSRTRRSLNEAVVLAEREQDQQAEKEDKQSEDKETDDEEDGEKVFPDNYYNNEVLNVTLDYVAALQGQLTVAN